LNPSGVRLSVALTPRVEPGLLDLNPAGIRLSVALIPPGETGAIGFESLPASHRLVNKQAGRRDSVSCALIHRAGMGQLGLNFAGVRFRVHAVFPRRYSRGLLGLIKSPVRHWRTPPFGKGEKNGLRYTCRQAAGVRLSVALIHRAGMGQLGLNFTGIRLACTLKYPRRYSRGLLGLNPCLQGSVSVYNESPGGAEGIPKVG